MMTSKTTTTSTIMMTVMMMTMMTLAILSLSVNAFVTPSVATKTTKMSSSVKTVASTSQLNVATTATTTTTLPEGMLKTITQQGQGRRVAMGDTARINYSCYLVTEDGNEKQQSVLPDGMPFSNGKGVRMMVGDNSMISGWSKALPTMYVGERAIFRITNPELGYGEVGVPPLIPPNSSIELDIEMIDSKALSFDIDFDALASSGVPTTPAEIAAAFEQSQAERAKLPPRKEGIAGIIERFETAYFFGFFDSETGEEAPWYLKPSLTFPLAFAIVGAAFYVSLVSGAITERGATVTDELDEIVVMSTNIINLILLAM